MSKLYLYDEDEEEGARGWWKANYQLEKTSGEDRRIIEAVFRQREYIAAILASVASQLVSSPPSSEELMEVIRSRWRREDEATQPPDS